MKIAVFGAGTMGSGIAQVFAGKGHTVLLYASSTASAQRHKDKLAASLNKRVAKGKMAQEDVYKRQELDIAMLLPLHGFVWRKELGYLLHKYDLWSRYEPEERGVLIAYASVYGNTENAANILACRLSERGVRVQMFDTSVTPT